MQPAHQEIKRQTPVCQVGEVGEIAARIPTEGVGGVIAEDEEGGGEDVEGDSEAEEGENQRWEEVGCCVAVGRVEGGRGTEVGVDVRHGFF